MRRAVDSRRAALRAAMVGGVVLLTGAGRSAAEEAAPVPAVTVIGEASAEVVPDIAHLTLGVDSQQSTAVAASAEVASAAQAMLAALKAAGVADTDVATAALELTPVYPEGGSSAARPRAFRGSTRLRVTVRPADRAGAIASQMVEKGANVVGDIDYASSTERQQLDALRADAMRDARHKADVYAGALGIGLGRVLEITPLDRSPQPPPFARNVSILAAPKAATLPASPGTLTLSAAASVRFALMP